MFRRFFVSTQQDNLSDSEEAVVMQLAVAQRRLVYDGVRLDTQSEPGMASSSEFLKCLDRAATAVSAEKASRTYRAAFTKNYRTLFPNEDRAYRVDVLDASFEQQQEMCVNGERFEFSADTLQRASELQRVWPELTNLFVSGRWNKKAQQDGKQARPTRVEICKAMTALDFAWAAFEQKYIFELIEIEAKARRLIVQAIAHARRLDALESDGVGTDQSGVQSHKRLAEWHQEQAKLALCIAHLNSVANNQGKGRDDLSVGILHDALAALRRCDAEERDGDASFRANDFQCSAARMLANDVVDSFAGMRSYLCEVECCLDAVDPHLCNNEGLVERLVDWEESWELGLRYVQNARLLNVLSDLVGEIRAAQSVAPALLKMCEDCDVELFMVLPRLVWLHFLGKPTRHEELLKSLLPHRFHDGILDSELQQRIQEFDNVQRLLKTQVLGCASGLRDAVKAAWQTLVCKVINGDCSNQGYQCTPEVEHAVNRLAHELEGWSMELQRHCPEDWNQLSAVLVQCLSGEKMGAATFRV